MVRYFYKKITFFIKNTQKWLKNAKKCLFLSIFRTVIFFLFCSLVKISFFAKKRQKLLKKYKKRSKTLKK